MFMKNRGNVQLSVELLDAEEENSEGPMEIEVSFTYWFTDHAENLWTFASISAGLSVMSLIIVVILK